MNSEHVEVHYINTGFPYTVTDSFMDLFEGLNYLHTDTDFALAEALQDQESAYWSLQTYSDKQGITGSSSSNSHNNQARNHEGHQNGTHTRASTRNRDNNSQHNNDEALARVLQETEEYDDITQMMAATNIEECNRGHHVENSTSQGVWQDHIDPDSMTYEELVELGEAVGTHNRGLCPDLIACLPVTNYKTDCLVSKHVTKLFSRRKTGNHSICVICHMDYKRGDQLITLPCKHPYHAECISRWLKINKACPVCYVEVFGS